MISVIVPTIPGREAWLERCHDSYCQTTEDLEFIVVSNSPTCNQGWNTGILESSGDYLHLSADDIQATEGWWEAGTKWIENGFLPAPRILNPDGTLQSCGDGDWEMPTGSKTELTRVPLFSRAQMETLGIYPIRPNGQYMGDAWVTACGRAKGVETVVVREMCFIHSFAHVGRLDEMLSKDVADWKEAVRALS